MKKNQVIGLGLLIPAIFTSVGMVIDQETYWHILNYVTIIITAVSGVVLLKQK